MIGFIYGALTGNFCGLLWEVAAYKKYFLKQPKFTSVNCCYVTMNYAFLYWYLSVRYLGVKKEIKRLQSSIASFHVSLIVFSYFVFCV